MTPPVKKNATAAAVGKKKMRTVQSGIGISSLDKAAGSAALSLEQSFLTSRTARVLLAGAGFLADAVRKIETVWRHKLSTTIIPSRTMKMILYEFDNNPPISWEIFDGVRCIT